jgi:hypothetical protein
VINQANPRGDFLMMAVPVAANGGVGPYSGDPLIFGDGEIAGSDLAGVAENSYTPPTGVPNPEGIGVAFIGVFFLTVVALDGLSPASGEAIYPGDRIFASGGTYDQTTGCTYGFTLDANHASGVYFGNALDNVPAGQTATIRVRLKVGG